MSISSSGRRLALAALAAVALLAVAGSAFADGTAQTLPYAQSWTDIGQITVNDDWSGVPGVIGYRGDGLTSVNDVDPQTVLGEGSPVVDVNANQTNPNTFATGGVTEFHITDPVVALTGSGTADAPSIVIALNTVGSAAVTVSYNLRDIDGSTDNAVQQVALQYRVGSSGDFTNVPAGYVADATTGGAATLVTPVSAGLPDNAANQPLVQVRVITTNASGNDEWVGIDDIAITGAGDAAPTVAATTPANGASEVPTNSDVTVTFSEPVSLSGNPFSISCTGSGAQTPAVSGGPVTYLLDPSDFQTGETCTVTTAAAGVSDVDTVDPPDTMGADHVFSFTTVGVFLRIHDIQGAAHRSPHEGTVVSGVPGVVTATRSNGFYFQDAEPDASVATSEAIFVFTGTNPPPSRAIPAVGTAATVNGRVEEFRAGCTPSCDPLASAFDNLTGTQIRATGVAPGGPGAVIAPTVIGAGGRVPPGSVIDDDATGDVETSGTFDAGTDGIDLYESMEHTFVQVNDAVVTGPTNDFGEIFVLADGGAGAGVRTPRGGIVIRATDFNPERIQLDDTIVFPSPQVDVGDSFAGPIVGVLDYNFGNFELLNTSALTPVDGGLAREVTTPPGRKELAVATFNVENLDPGDPQTKFDALAGLIVNNLLSPDLIALEEVQDNDGPANSTVVAADVTYTRLIQAIVAAGGPTYQFRQIDPVDDQDGGEPGGNIRVGFLFRTDRGLSFVDRPGAGSTTANGVQGHGANTRLLFSPGRIDPLNLAFTTSRKPLAGEFRYRNKTLFVIANHFNSKGGDDPLFGRHQPPVRSSEVQRHQQAQVVNDFVDAILAGHTNARVIVLGDINDFEFSQTVQILKGGVLTDLVDLLPQPERYTYVFEGNSQVLDHILVTRGLIGGDDDEDGPRVIYDAVHVNAEFADQDSDHDPSVARLFVGSDD